MPAAPTNTETLDSLYTTTWQTVKKQVVDNIFTATPFFYEMTKGENVEDEDGGRFIELPLAYAKNSTVAWIGSGGTISIADVDPLTTAIYNWYNIAGSVVRIWTDDMSNSGIHKKIDIMNAKVEVLRLSIIDNLETALFTAQTGNAPLGLPDIVEANASGAQSKTPGGLSKSTYTMWENKYAASSGSFATYGKSDMRTMYNNTSKGNDHPNLILTTQPVFEYYEAEAEDIQRINNSSDAKLGFQTFTYKGSNMYYSPSTPTGYMYFLNLKYLKFKRDSKANFDMTEMAIPTPSKTFGNQWEKPAHA